MQKCLLCLKCLAGASVSVVVVVEASAVVSFSAGASEVVVVLVVVVLVEVWSPEFSSPSSETMVLLFLLLLMEVLFSSLPLKEEMSPAIRPPSKRRPKRSQNHQGHQLWLQPWQNWLVVPTPPYWGPPMSPGARTVLPAIPVFGTPTAPTTGVLQVVTVSVVTPPTSPGWATNPGCPTNCCCCTNPDCPTHPCCPTNPGCPTTPPTPTCPGRGPPTYPGAIAISQLFIGLDMSWIQIVKSYRCLQNKYLILTTPKRSHPNPNHAPEPLKTPSIPKNSPSSSFTLKI